MHSPFTPSIVVNGEGTRPRDATHGRGRIVTVHVSLFLGPEADVRVSTANATPVITIYAGDGSRGEVTVFTGALLSPDTRWLAAMQLDKLAAAVLAARNILGEVAAPGVELDEDEGTALAAALGDAGELAAGPDDDEDEPETGGESVGSMVASAYARTLVRGDDGTAVELTHGEAWPAGSLLAASLAFAQAHPMTESELRVQDGNR